jgi:hypothetical protein
VLDVHAQPEGGRPVHRVLAAGARPRAHEREHDDALRNQGTASSPFMAIASGTNAMILKNTFAKKNGQNVRLGLETLLNYVCQNCIITFVFKKNAIFYHRKSAKVA